MGLYPDSKEQLGGYCVIDVPDLDAAISWRRVVRLQITVSARCVHYGPRRHELPR